MISKLSREKKRSKTSSGPASSAGLLSFYGEATESIIKIRPEIVMVMTFSLIVSVVIASIFLNIS